MVLNAHELMILLGSLLAGGVLVNLTAQFIKKVFKLKTDSVIHTMVIALSTVVSFGQYSWVIKSKLPPEVLGISITSIYGFSQAFFKYARYAQDFVSKVNAYNAGQKATTASNAAVAAVQAPKEADLAETPGQPAEFLG